MTTRAFANGPAMIAYLTLGDGGLNYSLEAALALVKGGVDLLEIGIPFSDPVADGPVIQKAMERSLAQGTRVQDLIPFLKELRKHSDIPVAIFSYCNPLLSLPRDFFEEAKAAGADGLLIVDLPFEQMPTSTLDPILVATPSTSSQRLAQMAQTGRGFLYYACQKGTTGMRNALPSETALNISRIRQVNPLPIAIGFGISHRQMAQEALALADGFVVGSYFVDAMARRLKPEELTALAKNIDPRSRP